jgi:hypothetical protein
MGVQLMHMVNRWQSNGVGTCSPSTNDEQGSKSVCDDSLTPHSRTTTTTIIITCNTLTRVSYRNYPSHPCPSHYISTTPYTQGTTHHQSLLPLITTHTHTSSNSDSQSRDRIGAKNIATSLVLAFGERTRLDSTPIGTWTLLFIIRLVQRDHPPAYSDNSKTRPGGPRPQQWKAKQRAAKQHGGN